MSKQRLTDAKIIPISLKQANDFVTENHRHHQAVRGCKFCIGLKIDNLLAELTPNLTLTKLPHNSLCETETAVEVV